MGSSWPWRFQPELRSASRLQAWSWWCPKQISASLEKCRRRNCKTNKKNRWQFTCTRENKNKHDQTHLGYANVCHLFMVIWGRVSYWFTHIIARKKDLAMMLSCPGFQRVCPILACAGRNKHVMMKWHNMAVIGMGNKGEDRWSISIGSFSCHHLLPRGVCGLCISCLKFLENTQVQSSF